MENQFENNDFFVCRSAEFCEYHRTACKNEDIDCLHIGECESCIYLDKTEVCNRCRHKP